MDEKDEMDQWYDLLSGKLSAKKAKPLISKGVAALRKFLASEPQAEQRVVDILSRRLSCGVNAETWDGINNSLRQYFGQDLAYLLYWVVGVEDPTANRMQEVEKYQASPEVMAFLRTIVGIFGPDLSQAFDWWNRLPDAWKTIYRDVYYDQVNQRHHIRVRIEKYNGEEIVIEGDPSTILSLTSYMIRTVNMVGTRDAFNEDSISLFSEHASSFIKLLFPEEAKKPAKSSGSRAGSKAA